MINDVFSISASIRYVAVYRNGQLTSQSKATTIGASSSETDRYEELLVNPTLLKLASQRGNIDCGGLRYLVVRYGNFFQFVLPREWGHISVCIESTADVIKISEQIETLTRPLK